MLQQNSITLEKSLKVPLIGLINQHRAKLLHDLSLKMGIQLETEYDLSSDGRMLVKRFYVRLMLNLSYCCRI